MTHEVAGALSEGEIRGLLGDLGPAQSYRFGGAQLSKLSSGHLVHLAPARIM
jgi:hypothetical protein